MQLNNNVEQKGVELSVLETPLALASATAVTQSSTAVSVYPTPVLSPFTLSLNCRTKMSFTDKLFHSIIYTGIASTTTTRSEPP